MHPRAIAIACDLGYFPGLQALINSITVYHPELPIFVFEKGLRSAEFAWLAAHPAKIEVRPIARFPFPPSGMWEAKQQIPAECITRARCVCLIDADIVLLSRIDDVFESAERGNIVAGCDGAGSYFGVDYQVYGPKVVGQKWFHMNTGLVCFDVQRHWDVTGLWAFSSNFGAYSNHGGYPLGLPGLGDQGLLDGLLALLQKHEYYDRLPLHSWHDFRAPGNLKIREEREDGQLVVENTHVKARQRIAHCIGYKWWMPGSDAYHAPDDKLKCLRHFGSLAFDPPAQANGALTVRKLKGALPGLNGSSPSAAQVPSFPALMTIHCTAGHEERERVEACLTAWRKSHPHMPGLFISDGEEEWHGKVAEAYGVEYHAGARVRKIQYGSLWLARLLVLAIDAADRHGCRYIWRIHPDTLVQRPFTSEPPDADWFGHIHNNQAPHVHGGSSFLRLEAAKRLLDRVHDCSEFADRQRWIPKALDREILTWAERTGWVSADFIIASLQEELGLQTASWSEVHSGCNMTPLPENPRQFAVLHPVKLPRYW